MAPSTLIRKLSEITPSGTSMGVGDTFVGVASGASDRLFSLAQAWGGFAAQKLTFANPFVFGAVADGTTDDGPAIQNTITSLSPTGGIVCFPPGVFGIATPISLPSTYPVVLLGSGQGFPGVGVGTTLRAIAALPDGVINSSATVFTVLNHKIMNMTVDANLLAPKCLYMPFVDYATFAHLFLINATDINFQLGPTGSFENLQGNLLFDIVADNPSAAAQAGRANYNFTFTGNNNSIIRCQGTNAQVANFWLTANEGGSQFYDVHGFNFPFTGAFANPQYNFQIDGYQSAFVSWEADGASIANVLCNNFNISLTNGISQTGLIDIQFGNGIGGCMISANRLQSAAPFGQVGVAHAVGNYIFGNACAAASGNFARLSTPTTVTDLPPPTPALANARALVTDSTGYTWGAAIGGGGGAITVPVWCDGFNWNMG